MELENLSIAEISAWKQSQVQLQAGVIIQKKANDQVKSSAEAVLETIRTPEPGKGQRLNVVA